MGSICNVPRIDATHYGWGELVKSLLVGDCVEVVVEVKRSGSCGCADFPVRLLSIQIYLLIQLSVVPHAIDDFFASLSGS
jgi:hypothetical protein